MNNALEKVEIICALYVLLIRMVIIKNIIKIINRDILRKLKRLLCVKK